MPQGNLETKISVQVENFKSNDEDLKPLAWLQNSNLFTGLSGSPLKQPSIENGKKPFVFSNEKTQAGGSLNSVHDVKNHAAKNGPAKLNEKYDAAFKNKKCCENGKFHEFTYRGSTKNSKREFSKPPYSFSCLIFMAIEASGSKAVPVKEIYSWIVAHYPYYRTAPSGWKNSVRHNLSLNRCFCKLEKTPLLGKGSLWMVEPSCRPNLLQALSKTSRFSQYFMQGKVSNKKSNNNNLKIPTLNNNAYGNEMSENMAKNEVFSNNDTKAEDTADIKLEIKDEDIEDIKIENNENSLLINSKTSIKRKYLSNDNGIGLEKIISSHQKDLLGSKIINNNKNSSEILCKRLKKSNCFETNSVQSAKKSRSNFDYPLRLDPTKITSSLGPVSPPTSVLQINSNLASMCPFPLNVKNDQKNCRNKADLNNLIHSLKCSEQNSIPITNGISNIKYSKRINQTKNKLNQNYETNHQDSMSSKFEMESLKSSEEVIETIESFKTTYDGSISTNLSLKSHIFTSGFRREDVDAATAMLTLKHGLHNISNKCASQEYVKSDALLKLAVVATSMASGEDFISTT